MILRVRKDACVGCGICVENCPRGAISVEFGRARIDQARCNRCGLCLDICPQHAIVEPVMVAGDDLRATITSLRTRADDMLERIDKLRKKQRPT